VSVDTTYADCKGIGANVSGGSNGKKKNKKQVSYSSAVSNTSTGKKDEQDDKEDGKQAAEVKVNTALAAFIENAGSVL
jgi:hypothetical protein